MLLELGGGAFSSTQSGLTTHPITPITPISVGPPHHFQFQFKTGEALHTATLGFIVHLFCGLGAEAGTQGPGHTKFYPERRPYL